MKIRRPATIVAGTLLAMAAATGSTQAQAESPPAGVLHSSLGSWAESAQFPKALYPAHQMCDEVGYSTRTHAKF